MSRMVRPWMPPLALIWSTARRIPLTKETPNEAVTPLRSVWVPRMISRSVTPRTLEPAEEEQPRQASSSALQRRAGDEPSSVRGIHRLDQVPVFLTHHSSLELHRGG